MRKLRATITLVTALVLAACQTVDGVRVNGLQLSNDTRAQAQPNRSGWMWAFGIAGAIGVGLLAAGGGGSSSGGISTGGNTGGSTGGAVPGPIGPFNPCNGCWDDDPKSPRP